jgi:uncharacterized membrane protein
MPSFKTEGHGRAELEVSAAAFKALTMGAIAGLRSMAAPALVAQAVRRGDVVSLQEDTPLFGALSRFSPLLRLLMVGEMFADKLPFSPSRNLPPSLVFRVLSGALVGAALFASEGRRGAAGAPLGAVGAALASSYGERLRVAGTEKLRVPISVLGHVEDGIVLLVGTRLLRRGSGSSPG